MSSVTHATALNALLLTGAIFGFFYAYAFSAMWGLDAIDPRAAIKAMQAINSEVRNAAFMPAFLLTPVALFATAALLYLTGQKALWFAAAGAVYLFGGLVLTVVVHIPMNEALAVIDVPTDRAATASIWAAYSPDWQTWNIVRTGASGAALLLAGIGLLRIS